MHFSYLALLGRIILLGAERIAVKQMGTGSNCLAATFLFFFIGALCLLPFALSEGAPWMPMLSRTLSSGFFYSIAFILYVRSLSLGEASLVSPLYNFNIFFLAFLAAFFLGESLTPAKLLGLALLVYGSSFLQPRQSFWLSIKALFKDQACQMMMAASLLIAVGRIIDKSGAETFSPMTYCCLLYFVVSAYVFLFILFTGKQKEIYQLWRKKPYISFISGAINGFSYLFLLYALVKIEVSIAEPVSMLGMLITLTLSRVLLQEKVGLRYVGALLMILGAWSLWI